MNRQWVKNSFQFMKAIAPFLKNAEAKVDFTIGKDNHRQKPDWILKTVMRLLLSLVPAVNLITDSNGTDIIFAIQHFIQKIIQFC